MTATHTNEPRAVIGPGGLPFRRFTVAEYYAMVEAGVLAEDDRVELLDGLVVNMAPIVSRHGGCVNICTRLFSRLVGERAILQVQNPIHLNDDSEPQPDLALLRERPDFYSSSHAEAEDVLLLIEVADTSLEYDRNEKLPRYARAGIPEVWLAVLPEDVVEVHTEPTENGYRVTRRMRAGDVLRPGCFEDIEIPVETIIPADGP